MAVEIGSTADPGTGELEALLGLIEERHGIDLHGLRREPLRDRLLQYAGAAGIADGIAGLVHKARGATFDLQPLLRVLTQRERWLFADPPWWRAVRERVVPLLRTYPFVEVWLPASGGGGSSLAMSILLEEEGLGARACIWSTGLAEQAFEESMEGRLDHLDLEASGADYLAAGGRDSLSSYVVVHDGMALIAPRVRDRIVYAQHNLATDHSFHEFQLVVCRAGLDELRSPLVRRACEVVRDSLCRLGVLALGRGEQLPRQLDAAFERYDREWDLFRRVR